jgi:hypothetical protein
MLRTVEEINPQRITIAIGAWISPPGVPFTAGHGQRNEGELEVDHHQRRVAPWKSGLVGLPRRR